MCLIICKRVTFTQLLIFFFFNKPDLNKKLVVVLLPNQRNLIKIDETLWIHQTTNFYLQLYACVKVSATSLHEAYYRPRLH